MKKHIYIIFSISALVAFLFSCSKIHDNLSGLSDEYGNIDYADISVSTANLPLFANLGNNATKSTILDDDSCMVSLESLLDREKTVSKTFRQYELTEIPFNSNEDPDYAVLSHFIPESTSAVFKSKIGLFLIETTDNDNNTIDRKVVTVIPDQDYVSRHPESELSFINKGVFSGTVLFSNLDGTFRDIYVYGGNFCPIINADIIDYSQRETYPNYGFLTLVNTIETKSDSDENGSSGIDELEPSYCIATKKTDINKDLFINFIDTVDPDDIDWNNGLNNPSTGGGGGGSGGVSGSGPGTDPGADSEDNKPDTPISTIGDQFGGSPILFFPVDEEVQKYKVSLYAAGNGSTQGSGEYQDGAYITCQAIPDSSYVFDRWVGDLWGKEERTPVNVTSDIEATAYFHHLLATGPFRPCYDVVKRIMNPLMEMSVAPSNDWNIKGGTFGKTRYNKQGKLEIRHDGLDLYAEPGTPIYAMHDGVISDYHYCTEQPNRITKDKYPEGYLGDTNGAGNRIHVKCKVDGHDVLIGYWHLSSDCPVAINPRTKVPFAPGDTIYQGELIGYTGKTGNCYGIPYYHLHLAVIDYERRNIRSSEKYFDPEAYINGNLDWADDSKDIINSTNIKNIKCHELYEKILF